MTKLAAHLDIDALEQRYKSAQDPVAKSHFHAVWLLARGYAAVEVAGLLSFSTRWVSALVKRYNQGGPSRLGDQRVHNGTEAKILTPAALAGLRERIKTPPDEGGLWSGPKVARWLARFHGLKSVHGQRGFDALVAIRYSIQRPRPRHPNAAGEAERAELKKNSTRPSRKNAPVVPAPSSRSGPRTNTASA